MRKLLLALLLLSALLPPASAVASAISCWRSELDRLALALDPRLKFAEL